MDRIRVVLGLLVCLVCIGVADDAAVVNGKTISTDEVEATFRRTQFSKRKLDPEKQEFLRKQVVRILVDEALVQQYLDERKVVVDEKRVDQHIAELTEQLKKQGKTLEKFLAEAGVTEEKMKSDIAGIQRWLVFVEGQATESALNKYFEANKSAFDNTLIRASHILVKADDKMTAEARKAARAKADELLTKLQAGADFAELAKANSDCPSGKEGGDLGDFPRKGVMTEPFAATAFTVGIGELSPVVETEFGYHIIKVTGKKPGMAVQFAELVDDVKSFYAEDLRTAVIAQMRAKADIRLLK